MLRGPINDQEYKGHFSGHDKFPFRYGWLTKLFEEFKKRGPSGLADLLKSSESIAYLGVGKNMVSSMRHWGIASGLFQESRNPSEYSPTPLGQRLLADDGWDPYLEEPASLWLLHWRLAGWPWSPNGTHKTTTWYWAFNHYGVQQLTKESMAKGLEELCVSRAWPVPSANTLKSDVECFLKSYTYGRNHQNQLTEDSLECPLAELDLISQVSKGVFEFSRGRKRSLPDAVFNFALAEFWKEKTSAATLTVDQITYEPGSPGLVFKLDESEVADRLSTIEQSSEGHFAWTETAGLMQVSRHSIPECLEDFLVPAFSPLSADTKAA